jgi:triosephosphate isomerase
MRDFLIAGNWKMNGSSAANAELVAGIVAGVPAGSGFSLLVCPPFPYLASVAEQVKGSPVKVGAQNVSEHQKGAFTGEVAPGMLGDIGCDYVIVGHSERRSLYGETSEQVAAKFQAAQVAGISALARRSKSARRARRKALSTSSLARLWMPRASRHLQRRLLRTSRSGRSGRG